MNELTQSMLLAFANNFTFYLKSHNYHWTVMGENFPQYHEFLEGIYTDAQESIDLYAEQLRRLGAFPRGNYSSIVKETELSDPDDTIIDPEAMFANLLADLDVIVLRLQDTFDMATTQREYGLQNFLADRIDQHRKQQWMLTATLTSLPESEEVYRNYPDGSPIPESLPELYQLASNDGVPAGENCANCEYYNADMSQCNLFHAEVKPLYWCAKWEPELTQGV
jgi:starvation-inducible DNA-binding protein